MKQEYKYDVALSFAIEDKEIAEAISKELKNLNISFYLFFDEVIWGANIKNETWQVYKEESMFALAIISKHYVKKRWSKDEMEVIQTVNRGENRPYLLPLRIDSTPVEGLSDTISYLIWNNDATKVAIAIKSLIDKFGDKDKSSRPLLAKQPDVEGKINISQQTGNISGGNVIGYQSKN